MFLLRVPSYSDEFDKKKTILDNLNIFDDFLKKNKYSWHCMYVWFWFDYFLVFQDFDFRSIRVNSPLVLVVNGKKFGIDKQAPSVLAVHALCDWWKKNLQQEQTWTVLLLPCCHSYLWLYKLNIFSYPLSCSFHDIHVQLYVSSLEQAIKY